MHSVYILRCADGSLYCGVTNNLARRLQEHNSKTRKAAKYTRSRQPVLLVYHEEYPTLNQAMKRELQIKRFKKAKKEALVTGLPEITNHK